MKDSFTTHEKKVINEIVKKQEFDLI